MKPPRERIADRLTAVRESVGRVAGHVATARPAVRKHLHGNAALRATVVAVVVVIAAGLAGLAAAPVLGSTGPPDGAPTPTAFDDRIPQSPVADAWDDAPARTVSLSQQQMAKPFGGGSVGRVRVQAVTNATRVAFRLTWPDATNDTSLRSAREYSDAVAIMLETGQRPQITMGANGSPVNIWYWRAAWQYGSPAEAGVGGMYTYPDRSNATTPARAVGNPLSKATYRRHAQNYYAESYGTLSYAPVQNVNATARRTDDGWSVVFVRDRSTSGVHDATLNESATVYLAFAVWNGSEGEANGQKSISLQLTSLDTRTGELAAVGGGDGDGGGEAPPAQVGPTDPGGGRLPSFTWVVFGGLVVVFVVTWLGVYLEGRSE